MTEKGLNRVDYWNNTIHHDSGATVVLYFDSSGKPVDVTEIVKPGMKKAEIEGYLGEPLIEHVDEGFTDVAYRSYPRGVNIRYNENNIAIEIDITD